MNHPADQRSVHPSVTLEQWQILVQVIDQGSFLGAAEAMRKSQSSISYAIQQLQRNLGVVLFEQRGRKAQLTAAGIQVLRRARQLLEEAQNLERAAQDLSRGWEPEVTLAVDAIFPMRTLTDILTLFAPLGRNTRLEILTTVLSGSEDAILHRNADLAITSRPPTGFLGEPLLTVQFCAIASPDHELLKMRAPLTEDDLVHHRQIVVRDSGMHRRFNAGWLRAEQRWTVSGFDESIHIVRQGLGFAFVPRHMVNTDIESGQLQLIPLQLGQNRLVATYLVLANREHCGPATLALAEQIRACTAADRTGQGSNATRSRDST